MMTMHVMSFRITEDDGISDQEDQDVYDFFEGRSYDLTLY